MRNSLKLLLAAVIAVVALTSAAGAASAVTVNNNGNATYTATTTTLQTLTGLGGLIRVQCNQSLTLNIPNGTYAGATLPVASVTRATFICLDSYRVSTLTTTVNWPIGWDGGLLATPVGTGPRLTVLGIAVQVIAPIGLTCLYTGNIAISAPLGTGTSGYLLGGTLTTSAGCGNTGTVGTAAYSLDHALTIS